LGNADLGLTQKYLQKRAKMQEAKGKKVKAIDTKATKNRKLRYIVHDKILNFTTPLDNLKLTEGRDAIVQGLFGGKVNRK
jgi:protein AATF/BFR2